MPIFVIAALTFSVIIGVGMLLMQPAMMQYMDAYAVRVRPRREKQEVLENQPKKSTIIFFCGSVGEVVLSIVPGLVDKRSVELLTQANLRSQAHLATLIGIKSITASCALFLGLAGSTNNVFVLLLMPFSALLGWIVPNFVLASRVQKRKAEILRELPTIIDLLIVCAQAGLGLMLAVDKVGREVHDSCPVLCEEMQQLIQDVKIFAKSVPVAMREMGERCGVDELISMASALIAAEQKGADISYPLKQQGEALRERLKRKKEEEAAKTPVKMVPVIMIFIMPLILAPMLGPPAVVIINVFSGIMK